MSLFAQTAHIPWKVAQNVCVQQTTENTQRKITKKSLGEKRTCQSADQNVFSICLEGSFSMVTGSVRGVGRSLSRDWNVANASAESCDLLLPLQREKGETERE